MVWIDLSQEILYKCPTLSTKNIQTKVILLNMTEGDITGTCSMTTIKKTNYKSGGIAEEKKRIL